MRISLFRCATLVALAAAASGCGTNDSPVSLRTSLDTVYWSMTLNAKAVTLAIGGTQTLAAQARNASGAPLPGFAAPTYRSADPSKVTVDAQGVVTGVAVTSGVLVIASLQTNGITNADTATVVVTATPQTVASFTIQPADSVRLAINSSKTLAAIARNADSVLITGLAVQYKSLDPAIASVTIGFLRGVSPGTARVVASTTSYGVAKSDTVLYTITYPVTATINMNAAPAPLSPAIVHVGFGAVVTWASLVATTGDITFDNGGVDIIGGNIPLITPFGRVTRTFKVPGSYSYKNTATGQTGTIIVHDN